MPLRRGSLSTSKVPRYLTVVPRTSEARWAGLGRKGAARREELHDRCTFPCRGATWSGRDLKSGPNQVAGAVLCTSPRHGGGVRARSSPPQARLPVHLAPRACCRLRSTRLYVCILHWHVFLAGRLLDICLIFEQTQNILQVPMVVMVVMISLLKQSFCR